MINQKERRSISNSKNDSNDAIARSILCTNRHIITGAIFIKDANMR